MIALYSVPVSGGVSLTIAGPGVAVVLSVLMSRDAIEVDVGPSLIVDGEAAQAGQSSEGALDDPAMASEPSAALDAASGDAWDDGAGPALGPAPAMVVAFVGVQLVRSAARTSAAAGAHARHRVQGGCQHHAVVPVGPAQCQAERRAARVDDEVTFAARPAGRRCFASRRNRRVRAGLFAPFLAGTDALSRAARLQSRPPASCNCSSSTAMQSRPNSGGLPVPQGPPARPATAAQRGRHLFPPHARAQYQRYASQRRPVRGGRPSALRLRTLRRQKRRDGSSEIVGNNRVHDPPTRYNRVCPQPLSRRSSSCLSKTTV